MWQTLFDGTIHHAVQGVAAYINAHHAGLTLLDQFGVKQASIVWLSNRINK